MSSQPRARAGDAGHVPTGSYRSPAWLPGGHAQTIWPYFLRRPRVESRREIVQTPDGDEWAFDWLAADAEHDAPLVVLFHGLEGSADSHYARWLLRAIADRRWRGVVAHFRGCAGAPNRTARAYHSGDHEEVDAMLQAVRARVEADATVFACGVSLGGSALLNWLGRRGATAVSTISRAAAVCAPIDLMACGLAIDRGANRIYARNFLQTLKPKALAMAARFPGTLDPQRIREANSMWAFDDVVTSRLHGFEGTADYWTRASSKPWLASIRLPTLVLNARNDPFVPAGSLPGPYDVAAAVVLEQPAEGGHMGFLTGRPPGRLDWLPQRVLAFFASES